MAARSVKSEPLKLTGVSLFKLGTNALLAKAADRRDARQTRNQHQQRRLLTMKDVIETRGKSKASKRPYMRLFTSDYRDGTAQLDFELQGFYFRILTYLHDGETVPADALELSRFLQCNARTTRKLLPKLIASGKLFQDGFELKNPRIERELELTSTPIRSDVELTSSAKNHKLELNQEAQNTTIERTTSTSTSTSISKDSEQVAAAELEPARPSPSVAAPLSGLADLHSRLVEACNGSLDNPANSMGLLSLATPQMWLDRGADLERDVIPTLEAAGKKYHGKRIRDWSYFTGMVADAVEKRKAELPKGGTGSSQKESARARRAKIFEKLQQEGRA
jgi:uncharacterized protein YdaU (DUF1376 family)